ncbi:hypothetical protein LZC95_26115 [Pendulispora brunnea]|uniref:Nucleotidyltransferase domain-containing protein n=1 Tax=Pendulispora brunnea TaxID=2905690 RepID=A0ABZ2JUB9_9BACT
MSPEEYRAFTEALCQRVAAAPDALGLVALGSMSGQGAPADAWSDHDFFVIVPPGTQERWRDSSWLPRAEDVVLSFRETAHGLKVVYRDGHLLEFAVFDPDEIALARVNRYRVLVDRADVEARMQAVQAATAAAPAQDDAHLVGQFLTQLLVGVARFRRGERLSAHRLVKVQALEHLLLLLARQRPSDVLDGLDPFRRVERAWPGLAQEIDTALTEPVDVAARSLLALARRELPDKWPEGAIAAVERAICTDRRT